MTSGLAVIFDYFKKFPCFTVFFFYLTQFNRRKLWCPLKFMPFNYSSLSYIVLTFTSAVSNLSNITLIFRDFPGPTIEFRDFPGLENEILQFHVQTLHLGQNNMYDHILSHFSDQK